MKKVYVVGAKRTAVGSYLGTLKDVHPADLGAALVKNILEDTKVDPKNIDEVIVGNILPAGLGQGFGRQVAIKGGLKETVPGYSLNIACGSGMKAMMNAYANIGMGYHDLVFAGGAESMSGTPFLIPNKARSGYKMGDMVAKDHMIYDALTDAFNGYHMGITAENIGEKYGITRESQDLFAAESQRRANQAIEEGKFKDEIVPFEVKKRRESIVFDTDEYPKQTDALKLGKLRAAFKKDGTVTAGNASGINDGASMTLLASEDAVKKYNLTPIAELVAVGQGGVDPSVMGLGPTPAIKQALSQINMDLKDIELIELNEAFAVQSLGVLHELSEEYGVTQEWLKERTNVNGGAIALGHPVGASGNRIVVTLLHEMKKRNVKYGLASLCIGGGMGTAVILKNV
ncbi:acetyl-CoA C-acetyltransferase [Haloplasma contractile]|uniref:acetyl-CoA C-acetyltransferase n=1 Tax=Haloplasma contractile SSD-17B TaxID=1033810 RepID=U2FFZ2_9MOLU|nr:acetyl-CoA C-acetyltransferase [Haloplasma contractile]ERJ11820.1 acetyl-CoA C-acetyltransferase protein [Haloplasma contractile SSD-17B]